MKIKKRLSAGCHFVRRRVEACVQRRQIVPGCAPLMQECSCWLCSQYERNGYAVQRLQFLHQGIRGMLVQVAKAGGTLAEDALHAIGGQLAAVNVRFLPVNEDLEIVIDNGKWLDKALSGVLAWTAFAPLVALPIVGVFRQKRLFDQVERDVVEWLASRYRLGCIDV